MDCEKLEGCTFFKLPLASKERELAFLGFVRMYCKGDLKEKCVSRMVGRTLGGPSKVPQNMMPNGMPLVGTDDSNWPPEVKALVKNRVR
jgi:hypothetical protein